MLRCDQLADHAPELGGGIARDGQWHGIEEAARELRKHSQRASRRRFVVYEIMARRILAAAPWAFEIPRIVQCREVNLVALMQLFQRAQSANLGAAIGWMQKKWADPKNFHRPVFDSSLPAGCNR